jgi:FlaA1/EpsC-like NDP-sugar epimerase
MINFLLNIPRVYKKFILIIIDFSIIFLSTIFFLKLNNFFDFDYIFFNEQTFAYLFLMSLMLIIIFAAFGQYKYLLRFIDINYFYRTFCLMLLFVFIYNYIFKFYFNQKIYLEIALVIIALSFIISLSIYLARYLMIIFYKKKIINFRIRQNCIIYGAGQAGKKLIDSVLVNKNLNILGILDDNQNLHNSKIRKYKILGNYTLLQKLKKKNGNFLILFSIINIDLKNKNFLFEQFYKSNLSFKVIPSLNELVLNNYSYESFRNLSIDDLLFRSSIEINKKEDFDSLKGKNVLVTGGAGSIGSQLVEELLNYPLNKIIIVDQSEYNIFKFNKKFEKHKNLKKVSVFLTSIANDDALKDIFNNFNINIVYHAAAYKHVSIVENNAFSALYNNVILSYKILSYVKKYSVNKFVLISTDKAVYPSNYMGLTKRLSEILVQNIKYDNNSTNYSIVRFGNVLGSSGSVIKIFEKQIKKGGPVIVFDKEVSRYFMTIREACSLVIKSTNYVSGEKIFVLDMGKPIKILDLAKKLINLYGLKYTFKDNDGSEFIKIEFGKLDKSEKLNEELSYEANLLSTHHKKILLSDEKRISKFDTEMFIETINDIITKKDTKQMENMVANNLLQTKNFKLNFKYK